MWSCNLTYTHTHTHTYTHTSIPTRNAQDPYLTEFAEGQYQLIRIQVQMEIFNEWSRDVIDVVCDLQKQSRVNIRPTHTRARAGTHTRGHTHAHSHMDKHNKK